MTRDEIYGIRCPHYSRIHRQYGPLPTIDLDMLWFKRFPEDETCVAVTEWKHGRIAELDFNDSQFRRIKAVARKLNAPAVCIVYYYLDGSGQLVDADDPPELIMHRQYLVLDLMAGQGRKMTERAFVRFAHEMRGFEASETFLDKFCGTWKPVPVPLIKTAQEASGPNQGERAGARRG